MANVTIDDLPPVTLPLIGTDPLETVQTVGGQRVSRKVEISQVIPAMDQSYIVVAVDPTLPNERALAVEAGVLTLTDNGPGVDIEVGVGLNGIDNGKLAQMLDSRIKGRAQGAGTGDAQDLTGAEVAVIIGGFPITSGIFTNSNPIDLVDTDVALNIGAVNPATQPHIEIDPTGIQSKSDQTTVNELELQPLGGECNIGQQTGTDDELTQIFQSGFQRLIVDTYGITVRGELDGDPAVPDTIESAVFFESRDGIAYGVVGFDGSPDFELVSYAELAPITLSGMDGVAKHPVFQGFPGAAAELYFDGVAKLLTASDGSDIRGSVAAATPPTTEAVDSRITLQDLDGSDDLGIVGYEPFSAGDLHLRNNMRAGEIQMIGTTAGGIARNMFFADPDNDVELFFQGSSVVRTLAAASGGLETNNSLTGGGFERVLTTSDLGGGGLIDVERFTASGTWTKPAGARLVVVWCIGGGGGGGGVNASIVGVAGAGGGGGRMVAWTLASNLAATETVTVGTGGAGGSNTGGAGTIGIDTTFSSGNNLVEGEAGSPGGGENLTNQFGSGGTGGDGAIGSNMTLISAVDGGMGGWGTFSDSPATVVYAGPGGSGGGIGPGAGRSYSAGQRGGSSSVNSGPGGGGGAAANAGNPQGQPGGNGVDGEVIVWTYQ